MTAATTDFEQKISDYDAFWDGRLNRALVAMAIPKPRTTPPRHADLNSWDNVALQVDAAIDNIENVEYYADSVPSVFPNVGPDFFPVGFGGHLEFVASTSHIVPFLDDWKNADQLTFNFDNPYCRVMEQLYAAFLERAPGKFMVKLPDLHPGADCLVGWRGPEQLCMDLFDHGDSIKKCLKQIQHDYKKVFFHYYDKLAAAQLPCNSWAGLLSSVPYGIPSCDFAYMISPEQFEEFFMPGLTEECAMLPRNIFHVDGKGVLNHLDAILTLPNLQIIQWVFGAGSGYAKDWIDVYKKCVNAGKAVQVVANTDDMDSIFATLPPEKVNLNLCRGIKTAEDAEYWLKRVHNWK